MTGDVLQAHPVSYLRGLGGRVRRLLTVSVLAVLLVLAAVLPSDAWSRGGGHHHHGFRSHVFIGVGVGPAFVGPWWWYYPPYYYPPPYDVYAPPPVVVEQQPEVYIQQQPGTPAPPPSAAQAPTAESFWYYCPSAKAYYPSALSCPEAWIKVAPRP